MLDVLNCVSKRPRSRVNEEIVISSSNERLRPRK